MKTMLAALAIAALVGGPLNASAVPLVPQHDDEIVETLPAAAGAARAQERQLRRELASQPRNAELARLLAGRELARAHALGDPRYAGLALAALGGWPEGDEQTPAEILVLRADVLQYLHQFDAAAATLDRLLARRSSIAQPQAWLSLATIRRVQGRYAESDAACRQVSAAGAAVHGSACMAENAALRGDVERARSTFAGLIAMPRQAPATRAWLMTSLAELEQRAGRPAAAEAAFKGALQSAPGDAYASLAYADLLIEMQRPSEALTVLKDQPRSDAVLLRLAIAGRQAGSAQAIADAREMRERITLENERPETSRLHGREQAMFELSVDDGDRRSAAMRAVELARGNVATQREPLDLLVYAQAARRSGDAAARADADRLIAQIGLRDERIRALP